MRERTLPGWERFYFGNVQPGLKDVEKEVAEKKDDGNQGSRTECSLFRELHPARGEEKHFTGMEDKKWQKNHAEQQDFFSNSSVGRQKTI